MPSRSRTTESISSTSRRAGRAGLAPVEHTGDGDGTLSDHDLHRVFQQLREPGEPAGPVRAVDGPVVDRQHELQNRGDLERVALPTTGLRTAAPTARIPACGGLMIASNSSTPNMPRLLTVSVPPWRSAVDSLPAFARPTASLIFADSAEIDSAATSRITGVTRPFSLATATATSAVGACSTASSVHTTFIAGTSTSAWAAALTIMSLTETLTRPDALSCARSASSASTRADMRR